MCRGPEKLQRLARREATRRRDLGAGCKCRIEHVDVERNVDFVAGKALTDLACGGGKVAIDFRGRDQQHPIGGDELELLRVVVPAARDDDPGRLNARRVEGATQRAAACPVATAGAGIMAVAVGGPLLDLFNRGTPILGLPGGFPVVFGLFVAWFVVGSLSILKVPERTRPFASSRSGQGREENLDGRRL